MSISDEKRTSNQNEWNSKHNILQDLYDTEYKDSKEYWHYTSLKGVLGIFSDYVDNCFEGGDVTKCSVLASNIRFMNDMQEYQEGVRAYEKISKKPCDSDMNDSVYLISFCGKGDLLSQWKWYGKNSGVALCFDLPNTKYETYSYVDSKGEKCKDIEVFFDEQTKPIDVRYTSRQKNKLFRTILANPCISKSNANWLIQPTFIPFCKEEGFKEEQESRLVFYVTELVRSEDYRPKFNLTYNTFEEGRVKPALKVGFHIKDDTGSTKSKNLINKIVIGPGENQELVFNAVIHIFDRVNYSYQTSLVRKTPGIKWDDFICKYDHKTHMVKCLDKKKREAYLCENGIVVMKSQIPFRG